MVSLNTHSTITMRGIVTIAAIFLSYFCNAQCKDSILIKPWGKWNQLQYNSAVYRLEHRTTDSILPSSIRSIVKQALIERCGEKFYANLNLSDLSIVIPIGKKKAEDDLIANGIIKKGEIKYYYSYSFTGALNNIYCFNIALDVQGKILTEWTLPTFKDAAFTKFITFCEATEIACNGRQAEVKKINDVQLMYDPKLNLLAWKVTIGFKAHIDSNYKTYRISINAFSGKIVDNWLVDLKQYDNPGNK